MIQNQFATYEIAKKIKEVGFINPCIAYYTPAPNWSTNKEPQLKGHFVNSFKEYFNEKLKPENVAAPLWQQVIDWLREKHQLVIYIRKDWDDGKFLGYEAIIDYEEGFIDCAETGVTYEEAKEQAILKALELITK